MLGCYLLSSTLILFWHRIIKLCLARVIGIIIYIYKPCSYQMIINKCFIIEIHITLQGIVTIIFFCIIF